MKKYFYSIISLILSLFVCSNTTCSNSAKGDTKALRKVVSYSYCEYGTMAQPNIKYTIKRLDDKRCELSYFNHDKNRTDVVTRPIAMLDSIEVLVNDSKVWKWKGSYSPKFHVLDGYTWHMNVVFGDGTEVNSSGSNARPRNNHFYDIDGIVIKYYGK